MWVDSLVEEGLNSLLLNRILLVCKERIDFKVSRRGAVSKELGERRVLAGWSAGWSMGRE